MYMNTVLLSVKYSTIPQKYKNFRKRSEDAQIIFVFTFILFYHFCFRFFVNYFHFCLALKVNKTSKTIVENRKLSFLFSSLVTPRSGLGALNSDSESSVRFLRTKSNFHPPTITKLLFSTLNYKVG